MSEQVFRLPDLGEGLTEAEIIEWQVAVGDTVEIDQHVVVVETAKATVEVPCPYAGRVLTLHGAAGQPLAVGTPLITIAAEQSAGQGAGQGAGQDADLGAGQDVDPGAEQDADAGAEQDADLGAGRGVDLTGREQYREEEQAGSGSGAVLIGYGTGAPRPRRRRVSSGPRPAEASTTVPVSEAGEGPSTTEAFTTVPVAEADERSSTTEAPAAPEPSRDSAVAVISPIVRRLARDHDVDLTHLAADVGGQVVRRAHVEEAMRAGTSPRARGEHAPPTEPAGIPDGAEDTRIAAADEIRIPLRGVRRTIADKLTRSRREIPDATTWVDVDATGLLEAKAAIQAAAPDARIGLLALLARICVAGLTRFPELNARVDTERAEIVQLRHINLGFAAQSPRGLVVPVVHGAQSMTTSELARALGELTVLAREGALAPAQMTGGTFTLNNYGVFGVDGSTPIINHPEAAMLGVGRIIDKPWAFEGQVALRKVTQLSFSFDHRVCDGGTAGGFLRHVADCVERPTSLLADL